MLPGLRKHGRHRLALALLLFSELRVGVPRGLPPLLRSRVGEGRKDLGRDVADFIHEIHDLVVAKQHGCAAPGLAGLRFERHQQVEDGARAFAAVGVVAGLNQVRPASGPFAAAIDQA